MTDFAVFLGEKVERFRWIAVMVASPTSMPVMTGMLRPFFQNTARARPPRSAPPVKPRSAKAAFRTKATWRLSEATMIKAPAQATVEPWFSGDAAGIRGTF